jgi:ribulose-5-phosphate 4-epimerase/fuculose-1-phosphate aldolase
MLRCGTMHEDSQTTRAELVKVGQATWDIGLNSLKSGNISLLLHNGDILITRTGRSMRGLDPVRDLISVGREETKRGDASCEFYVHRGIYTGAGDQRRGAILHCHGPCTIAATCVWDDHIAPSFNEAEDILGSTRILESRRRESYGEDPERIADALKDAKIVAVRGHGTFTLAETLEECLYLTQLLETSCRISFMVSSAVNVRSMGR